MFRRLSKYKHILISMSNFQTKIVTFNQNGFWHATENLVKKLALIASDLERKGLHRFADQLNSFGRFMSKYNRADMAFDGKEFISNLAAARLSALENLNIIYILFKHKMITGSMKDQLLKAIDIFCLICSQGQQELMIGQNKENEGEVFSDH